MTPYQRDFLRSRQNFFDTPLMLTRTSFSCSVLQGKVDDLIYKFFGGEGAGDQFEIENHLPDCDMEGVRENESAKSLPVFLPSFGKSTEADV